MERCRQLLVAPTCRESGREYKFGDLASYDGFAFKAKTGSAHRRPDKNSEIGWEVLNACDDTSKGAVQCELSNEEGVVDTKEEVKKIYKRAKQDMSMGTAQE